MILLFLGAYVDYSFLWERPPVVFSPPSENQLIREIFLPMMEEKILQEYDRITKGKYAYLITDPSHISKEDIEEIIKESKKFHIEKYIEAKLIMMIYSYFNHDFSDSQRDAMVLLKDPLTPSSYRDIAFYLYVVSSIKLLSIKYSRDVVKYVNLNRDFILKNASTSIGNLMGASFMFLGGNYGTTLELLKRVNSDDLEREFLYFYYIFFHKSKYAKEGNKYFVNLMKRKDFDREEILGLSLIFLERKDYDVFFQKVKSINFRNSPEWVKDLITFYWLYISLDSRKNIILKWMLNRVENEDYFKEEWLLKNSLMFGEIFYFRRDFIKTKFFYTLVQKRNFKGRNAFYYFFSKVLIGWLNLIERNFDSSLEIFDEVIKNSGNPLAIAMAFLGKGFGYIQKGDLTQAKKYLKVVRIFPSDTTSLYEISSLKIGNRFRYPILISYYIPFSLYLYGEVLEEEGEFDRASYVYRKIYTDFPYKPFSIFAYMKYVDYNIMKGSSTNNSLIIEEALKAKKRVDRNLNIEFPYLYWYLSSFVSHFLYKDTLYSKYADEIFNLYSYLHKGGSFSSIVNFLEKGKDIPLSLFFLNELRIFYLLREKPDFEKFTYFTKGLNDSLFTYVSDTLFLGDVVYSLLMEGEVERARLILSLFSFYIVDIPSYKAAFIYRMYMLINEGKKKYLDKMKYIISEYYPELMQLKIE